MMNNYELLSELIRIEQEIARNRRRKIYLTIIVICCIIGSYLMWKYL